MPTKVATTAELIRRILDGDRVAGARRKLVSFGGPAVEPVLQALVGDHGAPNRARRREVVEDLTRVLVGIARRDVKPLAAALAHDVPAFNMTVWALGHSGSRYARKVLCSLEDHEDGGVRAVAAYHLARHRAGGRGRKTPRRKP